jgi:hypothetical protein
VPYLRDIVAGTNDRLPVDSMLYRTLVAKRLNTVMGTTRFDAWNIDEIPEDDLKELRMSLQWLQELRENG